MKSISNSKRNFKQERKVRFSRALRLEPLEDRRVLSGDGSCNSNGVYAAILQQIDLLANSTEAVEVLTNSQYSANSISAQEQQAKPNAEQQLIEHAANHGDSIESESGTPNVTAQRSPVSRISQAVSQTIALVEVIRQPQFLAAGHAMVRAASKNCGI